MALLHRAVRPPSHQPRRLRGSTVFLPVLLLTSLLMTFRPAGSDWVRWTLARLQAWVEQQFGLCCSKETIRRALIRLHFSWKKARKLLARACTEARQRFLKDLQRLVIEAQGGRVLLVFCDEAHIHLDADLGYGWARRGLPFWVHSCSPGLKKSSFYGLHLYNYQAVRIWPYERANSENTLDVLTRLREQFPDPPIALVWDGASYHRSAAVRAKAAELNIELVRLPAYSPDFMPVEALWRWLRQEVTSLHCHSTVAELIERVADFAWSVNMDPAALSGRLALKTHLDPEEEKLRF